MRGALLAAGILLALSAHTAQGDAASLVLTLDEALTAALDGNREILLAQEQRESFTGKYVEERAAALPQVTGAAGAQWAYDPGLAVFPGAESSRRYVAQLELTQPLYSSGAVPAGIRAAKAGLAAAGDRIRTARQEALLQVHAAFHDVLLAKELSVIAVRNRDQKSRHLEEARKRYAAGTATDYDVLVADVALQNARPEVLRTANRVRLARERLRFLIGRGAQEVDAKGTLRIVVGAYPDHDRSLAVALENRPELSDLRRRREAAAELLRVEKAGTLPRLDFRGSVGYQDLDFDVYAVAGRTWSAGVFASWPLFDGFRTRGRVAQARSDASSLRIEEARLTDAIALEVRDAVNAVREAGETVAALAGTVGQAERLVEMAEKGYEYGVKTRLDVDDAQLNLTLAQGNLARARRDYIVAGAALRRAMGTLGSDHLK